MKRKIIVLICFIVFDNAFSQTFRNGFDNYEFNSGGEGQGFSFHSNVNHDLSNSTGYLESYITMFKATKDKRYLDKFILHAKRIQERRDDNNDTIKSKWGLAVEGSSIYAFPTFYALGTPKTDMTFGFGLYAQYKINNALDIVGGASYDLLKYQTTIFQDTSSTSGFLRKDIFEYSLFSVPMKLKINIGKRKIFFSISPGINYSILLSNHYQSFRPFSYESKLFNNGAMFISGALDIGINYKVSNNIVLYLQPEIVQAFSPIVYSYKTTSGEDMQSEDNYLRYFKTSIGINYNF